MKRTMLTLLATIIAVAGLHAFRSLQNSSISGKVVPIDAVESVWASNGTDSVRTTTDHGAFAFTVKPGTWKVTVDAKEPFKDAVVEKVEVKEGQNTDIGEIRLQQ